uniref:Uncharacterized protein n=1 Tax=Plectus sambesii TaxID=2011161 RepID=A0A914VI70_9BILA
MKSTDGRSASGQRHQRRSSADRAAETEVPTVERRDQRPTTTEGIMFAVRPGAYKYHSELKWFWCRSQVACHLSASYATALSYKAARLWTTATVADDYNATRSTLLDCSTRGRGARGSRSDTADGGDGACSIMHHGHHHQSLEWPARHFARIGARN